jgi:hypothetical protein
MARAQQKPKPTKSKAAGKKTQKRLDKNNAVINKVSKK